MSSKLSEHFEDLRRRFPDESALLITDAQRSFETMEIFRQGNRPPGWRCAYFEVGGTDFLVWEMDDESDRFHVFATIYNIPIGILRPSSKPRGMLVVAGFYIDLEILSEHIVTHFKAAKVPPEVLVKPIKQNVLMFGFCKSLGHHFWNEVSGLNSIQQLGIFDKLDGIIVGPYDYFNLAPTLRAKGKQVWKLNATGVIVIPDQLFMYHNNVASAETRNLVLENAAHQTPRAEKRGPSICFQIRRRERPWIHEEEKLAEIIKLCSQEWPTLTYDIDGHSSSQGTIADWQKDIQEETDFFNRLQSRVPNIKLNCTVGMDLNEKINRFRNVDLFVGPIGSGGVISSWLLRKPTITYGPRSLYPLMRQQEHKIPEGGSCVFEVPEVFITDHEGEHSPFDVDSGAIFDLIRQEFQKNL